MAGTLQHHWVHSVPKTKKVENATDQLDVSQDSGGLSIEPKSLFVIYNCPRKTREIEAQFSYIFGYYFLLRALISVVLSFYCFKANVGTVIDVIPVDAVGKLVGFCLRFLNIMP